MSRFVTDALDSVAAQTHTNFECVIVDDASTDGSAELIADWIAGTDDGRFRLIRNEKNLGQMWGFAIGLGASSGEFVAFLDADDIWFERYLEHHSDVLRNASEQAATSCSDLFQIDENRRLLSGCFTGWVLSSYRGAGLRPKDLENDHSGVVSGDGELPEVQYIPSRFIGEPWNVTSGIVYRRSTLEAVMPANPDRLRICADRNAFILCYFIGGSYWTPAAMGAYRRHGKNGFGFLPVMGTRYISPENSVAIHQTAILEEMLKRLLNPGQNLETMLPLDPPQALREARISSPSGVASVGPNASGRCFAGMAQSSRDQLRAMLSYKVVH